MERLIKNSIEYSRFRGDWECKSQFERKQESQEGHFSQMIFTPEDMPTFNAQHQRIHTDEKLLECKECGKDLVLYQSLFDISEFTLVRNLTNVTNVARPLVVVQILLTIKEFILVKNLMNVMNVGRPLVVAQTLLTISEFTLVRNHMNVRNVGKPLVLDQALFDIR